MAGRNHGARKPSPSLTLLREDFVRGSTAHKVDRERGIIYGVKVIGRTSPNSHGKEGVTAGTEYTAQALKAAAPLYEGVVVNKNHPPRKEPDAQRLSEERIGWLENVQIREDGIYADLHLLTSDPLTAKLLEAAEKNPKLFGLSHNAFGRGEVIQGKFQIVEIPEVRSVDVVADAGTTTSLFESKEAKPMAKQTTFRKLLEALTVDKRLPLKRRARLMLLLEGENKLCEMDDVAVDSPADPEVPGEAASPDDALKDGFEAAILAVVQDDTMDAGAKAKKIAQLLKTHEKLTTEPATPSEADSEEGADVEESGSNEIRGKNRAGQIRAMFHKDPDNPYESREFKDLAKENKALRLCLEGGVAKPSAPFLKALASLDSDAEMRELIAEKAGAPADGQSRKPRSRPPGQRIQEGRETVTDRKSFLDAILN